MAKPLAGIKVIELANFIAGPLCGTLLADMGADVIKVEPPKGDMSRATPPIRNGESISFVALNRNKRSLVLDLKRPEAIEILLKLAAQSDVFVEAYRPGALEKLGLGGAHVKAVIADVSLVETSIAAAAWEAADYLETGKVPQPLGNKHRLNAPYQLFATKDGRYLAIGTPNDQLFANLMTVLGLHEHIGDPRFGSYSSRKANEDALLVLVEPAVCARDSKEIEAALMAAGVPSACVNNYKEVFDDPQIIARGGVKDIEHPRLGHMRAVRNPILLDHDGPTIDRHAPMLGEHSEEILRQLGYSAETIGEFIAAGVTRNAQPRSAVQAAE